MQESHPPWTTEKSFDRIQGNQGGSNIHPYTGCIFHTFSEWSCWLQGQKCLGRMSQADMLSIFRQCSVLSQYFVEGLPASSASQCTSCIGLGRVWTLFLKSVGGLCYSDIDQTRELQCSVLSHHLLLLSKCWPAWEKKHHLTSKGTKTSVRMY